MSVTSLRFITYIIFMVVFSLTINASKYGSWTGQRSSFYPQTFRFMEIKSVEAKGCQEFALVSTRSKIPVERRFKWVLKSKLNSTPTAKIGKQWHTRGTSQSASEYSLLLKKTSHC